VDAEALKAGQEWSDTHLPSDFGTEQLRLQIGMRAAITDRAVRERNKRIADSNKAQWGGGLIIGGFGLQILGMWIPYLLAIGASG
jgi:hypothetical protein